MGRTSHIWNGKIWKNKGHVPNHQNGYVSEYHHVQSPKCSQQCHLAQWGGLFHLSHHGDSSSWRVTERHRKTSMTYKWHGYGSIPIHTIFRGMNIHLPAILGFTRYQGFDPSPHDSISGWTKQMFFVTKGSQDSDFSEVSVDSTHTLIIMYQYPQMAALLPVRYSEIHDQW